MIFKCLIIDDEPLAIKVLESHISSIPTLSVVGTCHNAFAAMEFLQKHQVDLIFLDIQMPKLMGHDFFRSLRNPPKVIFTTAYKEYAVDAFELEATDYLLKPITMARLMKAVNKLGGDPTPDIKTEKIVESESFVYLRAERKMIKVGYDDILYIESMKDYVKVVRISDKPLFVKQSISSLEELLPPHLFLRIHRSYIVSLDKITAVTNHDVEIGSTEIPIGRLYAQQLTKSMQAR